MTLDRVVTAFGNLTRNKRMAVGESCAEFPRSALEAGDVSFNNTVTAIWTWYREELRHDLDFLAPRGDDQQRTTLKEFGDLLDVQRHFNQHANYDRADEAQAWRKANGSNGVEPSDAVLIDALLNRLEIALNTAVAIAARVCRDASTAYDWRNHNARTPESEMRAVLADIGLGKLNQRRVDTIVRRFKSHPELKRAKTSQDRANIAAVVAMEMNLAPLTTTYNTILDEFGLIGHPLGFSLLLVAHGVENAGNKGGNLIPVLHDAWECISPSSFP